MAKSKKSGTKAPAAKAKAPSKAKAPKRTRSKAKAPKQAHVTVTDCPESAGVTLRVNGRALFLPRGKRTPVPAWALPSLEAAQGIQFTKE